MEMAQALRHTSNTDELDVLMGSQVTFLIKVRRKVNFPVHFFVFPGLCNITLSEGGASMAKMIPERPSDGTLSRAERKLYPVFKAMDHTEDWVILHSVAIAKHITQSQGEADFVVIVPGIGTFALEVKGGIISQSNGKWTSTDRNGELHYIKNPVEEANNAIHSIMDYIRNADAKLDRTLSGFGVVFPDISYHGVIHTVEIADEQVADYDDCSLSSAMKAYILRLADYWKKRRAPIISLLAPGQVAHMVDLLRPEFEGRVSLHSLIRNAENQVVELTENQQDIFETIVENERCLVKGSAGTGKTIIALHFAKQQAEKKIKTGFFCYNKQLADYLSNNVSSNNYFSCGSFTEYMVDIVDKAGKLPRIENNASARNTFYQELLPSLFMEAFLELEIEQFDCLILDEAQDLMTEHYLEALDFILKDGLCDGHWYFFMDAEKQNIFHVEHRDKDVISMLKAHRAHFTQCTLRDNCRNSVAIIEKVDAIFGTTTRHRNNDERGAEVVVKTYRKTADKVAALDTILRTLMREGIPLEQIAILSPIRYDNSGASMVTEVKVTTNISDCKNAVYFSTIHGFKGLERPVIILSDFDSLSDETKQNILYVGMTRAKSALYILVHEKSAKFISGCK